MKKISKVITLVPALAMMLTLVACGSSPAANTPASTGSSGRTKDSISILMESVPDTEYVKQAAEKFTAETGVAVNIEAVNYQTMHEKLVTELTGSTSSYDILCCDNLWVGEFAEAGWCEPLDSYIASSGFDTSVYLESMTNMMTCNTIRDKTFFIPFCSYTYSLLYRTDIFENEEYAAAYKEETGKEFKVPETVEEYVSVSKFITKHSGGEIYGAAMQGQRSDPIAMEWTNFLFGCGGDYFDADNNPTINSPEAVKALEYYIENITEAAPKGSAGFGFDEALAVFMEGKAAMYIGNYWMIPQLDSEDNSQVKGLVSLTSAPGGHSNNGGWGWAIPHNGEDKDTAWEFIQFIESKEIRKERALKGGSPTTKDIFEDADVLAAYPYYAQVIDIIANAKQLPNVTELPQILEILGRELSEAVSGTKDPQSALDTVQNEMNQMYA